MGDADVRLAEPLLSTTTHIDGLQCRTLLESRPIHLTNHTAYINGFQLTTAQERKGEYARNRVGEFDMGKACAALKSSDADRGYALFEDDGRQARTILESAPPHVVDTAWDEDCRQACAACERLPTDALIQRPRERHGAQVGTFEECLGRDVHNGEQFVVERHLRRNHDVAPILALGGDDDGCSVGGFV